MSAPLTSLDRPNSYIGRSVPRPNAKRLLAGRGRYVSDLRLPRMLYAAFLRSPHAHAKIVSSISSRRARSKGCISSRPVRTSQRSARPGPARSTISRDDLGTAIAAAARSRGLGRAGGGRSRRRSRAIAEDALELIEIDSEELPVVADIDSAREAGGPLINPGTATTSASAASSTTARRRRLCACRPCGGRRILLRPPYRGDAGAARHRRRIRSRRRRPHRASRDTDAVSVPGPLFAPLRHPRGPRSRDRDRHRRLLRDEAACLSRGHGVVGLSILLGRPVKYVADRTNPSSPTSTPATIASAPAWRLMPRARSCDGRAGPDRNRGVLDLSAHKRSGGQPGDPPDRCALSFQELSRARWR